VKRLFPEAKLAIGPPIEEGFYYDFDIESPFTEEEIARIEEEMAKIIKEDIPFVREEISKEEAENIFRSLGEEYKLELLSDIEEKNVSVYRNGDFVDLCRGPHLPSTGWVKFLKLTSVAGAYWRGDERNKMLQRIYGISFPKKKELKEYLHRLEEAKKRDHRILGAKLNLFMMDDSIGPGLVIWKPEGAVVREIIEDYWKSIHRKRGYQYIYTPHIARLSLWETSGHTEFYSDNMFQPIDVEGQKYQLKPMNCPFHMAYFRSEKRSYRDLPMRLAELGTVYRYERSGVLHGLLRVRGFTQDDAHIFCTEDNLKDEIIGVLDLTFEIFAAFGFKQFDIFLSTRPEKFAGTEQMWKKATSSLTEALKERNIPFKVDPGEGVFYGPKIDIKVRDTIGRVWQCTTVQVDFNLPEKFGLEYSTKDGTLRRPIVIHRAILGSLERFFGILIEQYAGEFPLWLAPIQVAILPVSQQFLDYASSVAKKLEENNIRPYLDKRDEKLGRKIRDAELKKRPYIVIVGEREEKDGTVSVRKHKQGELGTMTQDEFILLLKEKISNKEG